MQRTLPARLYGDPDAYARERQAVFGRAWLFLGHEAEAPEPGDWVAAEIAGHRLMMMRGAENYLESYHIPAVHPVLTQELGADYRVWVDGELVIQESAANSGGPQAGLWGWLWPNLAVNVYRDGAMIERMVPDGPGRTRLDYLFLRDDGPDALADALEASDRLTAEDASICEAVQKNLSAGAYDTGVLSPTHEAGVAWFQSRIAEAHR